METHFKDHAAGQPLFALKSALVLASIALATQADLTQARARLVRAANICRTAYKDAPRTNAVRVQYRIEFYEHLWVMTLEKIAAIDKVESAV